MITNFRFPISIKINIGIFMGNRIKAPRTKAPLGQKPPDKKHPNNDEK
jgi:hypothetical protein